MFFWFSCKGYPMACRLLEEGHKAKIFNLTEKKKN